MKRVIEALLAVLVAAYALPTAGVTYLAAPAGPSQAEVAERNEETADAMWDALPIAPGTERPIVEVGEPVAEDDWSGVIVTCLVEVDFAGSVTFDSGEGPQFILDGEQTSDEDYVDFYACLVAHPRLFTSRSFYSQEQLDYQYAYDVGWMLPCLGRHGYRLLGSVPTAPEFHEAGGGWSPFDSLEDAGGNRVGTESDYALIKQLCGTLWFENN